MSIIKDINKDGMALGFHRLAGLVVSFKGADVFTSARILSNADEDAYMAGVPPVSWSTQPVDSPVNAATLAAAQLDVVAHFPELQGGQIVADITGLDELASAKRRKWSVMRAERDRKEHGGFEYLGGTFDSDPISQQRINGAVTLAMLAQAAGQPYEVTWTLADNTTMVLDGPQACGMGAALGTHVKAVHAIGRAVRLTIDEAQTVEEVEAITWPIG